MNSADGPVGNVPAAQTRDLDSEPHRPSRAYGCIPGSEWEWGWRRQVSRTSQPNQIDEVD